MIQIGAILEIQEVLLPFKVSDMPLRPREGELGVETWLPQGELLSTEHQGHRCAKGWAMHS